MTKQFQFMEHGALRRVIAVIFLAGLMLSDAATAQTPPPPAAPIQRGFGPVTLVTKRGPVTVRLLRRERDLVWIDQLASSGKFIETGVATGDIVRIEMPRPKVFDQVEQAKTPEQMAQTQAAIKRVSDLLRTYRDLPGVPVDEAMMLQAKLLERQADWKGALAMYEDLLKQPYGPKEAEVARLRVSLCYAKLERHDDVLASLDGSTIPDDDLALSSDLYYARAQARASKGRHQDAVMDFLHLVVFEPYVGDNEPKALEAVIPSYIAMQDWDAVAKTMQALKSQYPDSENAKRAEALLAKHDAAMAAEAQFHSDGNQAEEAAKE